MLSLGPHELSLGDLLFCLSFLPPAKSSMEMKSHSSLSSLRLVKLSLERKMDITKPFPSTGDDDARCR